MYHGKSMILRQSIVLVSSKNPSKINQLRLFVRLPGNLLRAPSIKAKSLPSQIEGVSETYYTQGTVIPQENIRDLLSSDVT